ncbi:MAG TPA: AAA family ATPase [Nitrospiria bacterium]
MSKNHQEAFSHVTYGIQQRKGFVLITGEVGTGKTTLCRLLLDHLGSHVKTSLIFNPNLSTLELLKSVNQDFGLAGNQSSKKELVDDLNQFLLKEIGRGGNAVLIIDEAQNLTVQCLEEIRMLSNLETENEKLLQILLVGQPELREKLHQTELRQLNQRIALRYHLLPLNEGEVDGYIAYRLKIVNGRERAYFTPEAVQDIHRLTGGIPRLINIFCDKALLAAYVSESHIISRDMVKEAASELKGLVTKVYSPDSEKRKKRKFIEREKSQKFKKVFLPAFGVAACFLLLSIPFLGNGENFMELSNFKLGGFAIPKKVIQPFQDIRILSSEENIQEDIFKPGGGGHLQEISSFSPMTGDSRWDSNGIFRENSLENTRFASWITLMALWDSRFYTDLFLESALGWGSDLQGLLAHFGFERTVIPLKWDWIQILDQPVILTLNREGREQTVVLRHIAGGEVIVLNPIRGKEQLSLQELKNRWGSQGEILWQPLRGIMFPLGIGDQGPHVANLQNWLKKEGFYTAKVDGQFGWFTMEAIFKIQKELGLPENGDFGEETALFLTKKILGNRAPSLEKPLVTDPKDEPESPNLVFNDAG